MLHRIVTITIAMLFCLAVFSHEHTAKTQRNRFRNGNRIIGGRSALPESSPWQIGLVLNNKVYCGGTLVRPDVILTAAHCITSKIKKVKVMGGHRSVQRQSETELRRVLRTISHEKYNFRTVENDIALLKIDHPFNALQTATLPKQGQGVTAGTLCVVSGWGTVSAQHRIAPTQLQEATIPLLRHTVCNDRGHYNGMVKATMLCAGHHRGGVDSCQGDSGGPLVCPSEEGWVLQGIISWGNGCAVAKYPGVYTRVASYVNWISDHLADL